MITFALEIRNERGVEQLVARQAHNLEVVRSSRASATQGDFLIGSPQLNLKVE